jgi:hypothetical protein
VVVKYAAYFVSCDNDNDIEAVIDQCVFHSQRPWDGDHVTLYTVNEHTLTGAFCTAVTDPPPDNPVYVPKITSKWTPDYTALRPLFGWLSPQIIQKTVEHTTQYARIPCGTLLKHTFKSPNPALNVMRRNEPVACDIVYADTISFAPCASLVGKSEPHQQQQNPAERRYQTVKTAANRIMDRTGAPPESWLLCLQYVRNSPDRLSTLVPSGSTFGKRSIIRQQVPKSISFPALLEEQCLFLKFHFHSIYIQFTHRTKRTCAFTSPRDKLHCTNCLDEYYFS